jgi:NitT/TauT family transport system substrate-binding protein
MKLLLEGDEMGRRWEMKFALTIGAVGAALAVLPASGKDLTKITLVQAHSNIGVGEEVFLYAVPKHLGYFEEEGLDVDIQGAAGGTLAAQVLQGGSAQVASVAPESVMIVRDKGGDIRSFASLRRKGGWQVAVKQGSPIKSLADLKGKNVGVQGLNSGVIPLLKSSLSDAGMQATDYTLLAAGSGPQAAAALSTGKIDALVLWDAEYGKMENNGLQLSYIDLPIVEKLAGFTLASTGKFMKENPQALVGFCRAMAKGQVFARANPNAAIKIFYTVFPQTKPKNVPEDQAIRDDANILKRWMTGGTGSDTSVPVGWQYPDKWAFTLEHYTKLGQISNPKPVTEYYTNDYMKECNSFDQAKIAAAAASYK